MTLIGTPRTFMAAKFVSAVLGRVVRGTSRPSSRGRRPHPDQRLRQPGGALLVVPPPHAPLPLHHSRLLRHRIGDRFPDRAEVCPQRCRRRGVVACGSHISSPLGCVPRAIVGHLRRNRHEYSATRTAGLVRLDLAESGQIALRKVLIRLRVQVHPHLRTGAGDRPLDLRRSAGDQNLVGNVGAADHQ